MQTHLEQIPLDWSLFLEDLPDPVVAINADGFVSHVNRAIETKFGYRPVELLGKNVSQLIPRPLREQHDRFLKTYLKTGTKNILGRGRKVVALHKNGREFPVFLTVTEQVQEGKYFFVGILRDLSFEDELNSRMMGLLKSAPDIILLLASDGKIQFQNKPFRGQGPGTILGVPFDEIFKDSSRAALLSEVQKLKSNNNQVHAVEPELEVKFGKSVFKGALTAVRVGNALEGMILRLDDITEKKAQIKNVDDLIEQKDLLLREVFHRVKNNYQTIISMLSMQQDVESSFAAKDALAQARSRVVALSAVHELLYEENKINKLDLCRYLKQIVANLLSGFQFGAEGCEVSDFCVQNCETSPDLAIAFGSVLNELLTNTYKYCDRSEKCHIFYSLCNQGDAISLAYSDSGDFYKSSEPLQAFEGGLGSRLIQSFCESVQGKVEVLQLKQWVRRHPGIASHPMLPRFDLNSYLFTLSVGRDPHA